MNFRTTNQSLINDYRSDSLGYEPEPTRQEIYSLTSEELDLVDQDFQTPFKEKFE
jgi:hypothetical protein